MNYYWISINDKPTTVAYGPDEAPLSHYLINEMMDRIELPFPLELHEVYVNKSLCKGELSDNFYDFQPNELAWPVMSEKMKTIIDNHLIGEEGIEWKEVIINGKSMSKKYYIPMFTKKLDTLNASETVYGPYLGIIMKHCFDKEKIGNFAVIHGHNKYWQITTQIYVNDIIRKELIKAGIEELEFDKVRVV